MQSRQFANPCIWLAAVLWAVLWSLSPSGMAADWSRFRGPNGTGISEESGVPKTWSDTENIKWKAALPGPGLSSPIVVGERVFVTSYSGYALDVENPGQPSDLKRHLVCVSRDNGRALWSATIDSVQPEDPYRGFITQHGYASHTPTSDGERVYAFFGKSGVIAFDLDGKKIWQTSVGTQSGRMHWGSAASPILYRDLVIVNASDESQSLVALNKATGKEVWRNTADKLASNWSTPVLIGGKKGSQLLLAVTGEIWALDPATGKRTWRADGFQTRGYTASFAVADGVAYLGGGMVMGSSFALRTAGAAGNNDSRIMWSGKNYESIISPIVHGGYVYGTTNKGIVYCVEAKTGKQVYQARLASGEAVSDEAAGGGSRNRGNARNRPGAAGQKGRGGRSSGRGRSGPGGGEYASPVLADGRIYIVTRSGITYVLDAKPEFKVLARNPLTSDTSGFCATPAISSGDIFLRSNKFLYCVSSD